MKFENTRKSKRKEKVETGNRRKGKGNRNDVP